MSMGTQRKLSTSSHSIDDYPEHLNPFYEDDNHNKIRFWTIGRKSFRDRSSSFSISGLKDLRSTWSFKSFMRKGRRDSVTPSSPKGSSVASSPIIYRKPFGESSQNGFSRNTVGVSPSDQYVYGGSVTPLPRSRFLERVSHLEQRSPMSDHSRIEEDNVPQRGSLLAVRDNKMNGSCLSVQSANAFGESPVRASARKKRRAPPPPPPRTSSSVPPHLKQSHSVNNTEEMNITNVDSESKFKFESSHADVDINDPSLHVELKIVEDDDISQPNNKEKNNEYPQSNNERLDVQIEKKDENTKYVNENVKLPIPDIIPDTMKETAEENEGANKKSIADTNGTFQKINITKYKRGNSIDLTKPKEHSKEDGMEENSLPVARNEHRHVENKQIDNSDIDIEKSKLSLNGEKTETNDSTMKDFIDIDRATQELEMEIKKLNQEMETMYENEPYKRKTVSDMKLIFDVSNDMNTPNPIPKPRRSRLSISSSESNKLSPTQAQKSDCEADVFSGTSEEKYIPSK